jgi:putative ABC transport system permease protein
MRDWTAFVRSRLKLPDLAPERESRIVRELAAQLEDFYREALARGADEEAADAYTCEQIHDWERMAQDVWLADRRHAKPRFDRAIEPRLERLTAAASGSQQRRGGGLLVLSNMIRDIRFGARQLVRTPGFTIVAILTLALGIGVTSAIFTVVNAVLLRPLPYPDAQSIVRVNEIVPQYGPFSVAPANFLDWRQQNTVFERIGALNSTGATLIGKDGPQRIAGALVSWNMFELVGVAPMLGRSFRAEEDAPGKDSVIVVSHGMWQRRFNGDPNILGQSVTLNSSPVTIVGVMPAGFTLGGETEFWRPLALNPANAGRGGHFLAVLARLKPGISIERAEAEMKSIAERLATQYPQTNASESAQVVGLQESIIAGVRPALLTLLAAVVVVILIACANVANLLLVRATVRGKEIAVRSALGASRGRIIVQMVSESLVLAVCGGALGLFFAYWTIRPIQTLSAGSIPRASTISMDMNVLLFAVAVSIATGILFGLAPAWQASRTTIGAVLKEGGRTSTSASARWIRNALLVGEVAMSIVLLVGAALLLRSFSHLVAVDPGFKPEHVLAFRVALPNSTYPDRARRIPFFETLMEKLEALPDVASAATVQTMMLRGDYVLSVTIQGRPQPKPNEEPSANYRSISPHYFQTMGIPLLRGRFFSAQDREKSPLVAIVDQAFVDRHFPTENPIGQRIDIGNGSDGFCEIVGVVGSVRQNTLEATPTPTMYAPSSQDVFGGVWVVVRTKGDPTSLSAAVRQTVRDIDNDLPAFAMTPLTTVVEESVAQRRFSMLLLSAFAGIALFLAAVGLYGVVAYTVSQRTQEIGLRVAIGAQPRDVLRMVVGGGMKLALAGVAIGIVCALGLANVVATMLFQVTPFDPVSYSATSIVLLIVAALACYFPARRATRVDPIVALRQE